LPSSASTINLSLPKPALTNALTNVPARLARAESTLADSPDPIPGLETNTKELQKMEHTRSLKMTLVGIFKALGICNTHLFSELHEMSTELCGNLCRHKKEIKLLLHYAEQILVNVNVRVTRLMVEQWQGPDPRGE
jgi:hypothetical protein